MNLCGTMLWPCKVHGDFRIPLENETSWHDLLDHGDEPFEAAVVHTCYNQDGALFDSIVECEVA